MLYNEKMQKFTDLLKLANEKNREDLVEFLTIYIDREKKNKSTLTKSQKANLELKEMLLDISFDGTATEVTNTFNHNYSSNYSRNKIASLLTMLVRENKIKREMVGKTAIFKNGGKE